MNIASLRVGRVLAPALLCLFFCLASASRVPAVASHSFTLIRSAATTLTPAALAAAQKTETPGHLSLDGKTLAFRQKVVCLVVVTGPENDMLSYRIGGLRNPALVVSQRATVRLLFVNADNDMPHNIRFGPMPKRLPNVMADYMKASVGTPELSHQSSTLLHGEELTFQMPAAPGVYAYLCTVRGHAQSGMVGKVIVRQTAKAGNP
jgi:plastocyanin